MVGVLVTGSTITVALATVLGQLDPALVTVNPTTFKPTPNEVKVAV